MRAIGPDGQPFTVLGQMAKVLLALIAAGEAGVDPLARETWSLRLSDHVRKLKTLRGLSIATMWGRHDKNGGPNHLKAWREFHRMTQAQLAEKVDTTANMIGYLEEGQRGLSLKWLRRLAPALKTTPGFLADIDPTNADTRTMELALAVPEEKRAQVNLILESFLKDGTNS